MDYWKNKDRRAEHARTHTIEMEKRFSREIDNSIFNSVIVTDPASYIRVRSGNHYLTTVTIDPNLFNEACPMDNEKDVYLELADSVEAAIKLGCDMDMYPESRVTLLNFASSTNPGGMFMQGSSAQEESICHQSTLYNVLSSNTFVPLYDDNRKNRLGGIYQNRGIWTPDIVITSPDDEWVSTVNVLTLPAPNLNMVYRTHTDRELANEAFRQRMRLLIEFANMFRQTGLILGAWGCGAFGWPANWVAQMMRDELLNSGSSIIKFSIIDTPTLNVFRSKFNEISTEEGTKYEHLFIHDEDKELVDKCKS